MDLHPHLHLLVPSSTPGINLEVRFYIPRHLLDSTTSPRGSRGSKAGDQLLGKPKGWSNTSASIPVAVDKLDLETLEVMKGVERLIIASHPWGRFGGNMLYPVIALHLVSAALIPTSSTSRSNTNTNTNTDTAALTPKSGVDPVPEEQTAVLCYNVRGVGNSEGRQAWVGAGEADYGAVENWGLGVTGVKEVWRFGYSWGSISATHAPLPPAPVKIRSMFLLSPPLSPLKLLRWYQSLITTIGQHLQTSAVWLVYGSSDEFTKKGGFKELEGMVEKGWGRVVVVEDASHFWGGQEGDQVREVFREWLRR